MIKYMANMVKHNFQGTTSVLLWIFKLTAAIILLQTLFFKFTASSVSVYIFSSLGVEPWGRVGTAIIELTVSILLIIPRTTRLGAMGGLAVMGGAILSHIAVLGIEVQNDGGLLFTLALITFFSCLMVLLVMKKLNHSSN